VTGRRGQLGGVFRVERLPGFRQSGRLHGRQAAAGVDPVAGHQAGLLDQVRGRAVVLAGGTIARGDRLMVAAGGKVVLWAAGAGINASVVGGAARAAVLNDLFEVELAGPFMSRQG